MPHGNEFSIPDLENPTVSADVGSLVDADGMRDKNAESEVLAHLDAIGMKLAANRSSAIEGREATGIEDEWLEDEEYYEGIDDANRGELKAWSSKPLGSQVPPDDSDDEAGSTIFLNITRSYCDAVAARIGDMLMTVDEPMFSIKPTPKPELLAMSKGKIPKSIERAINNSADTNVPGQAEELQAKAVAEAKNLLDTVTESAKKAQVQIADWHAESSYPAHNRRLIEDAAKVGTGVLKGPVPAKTTKMVYKDGKIQMVEEIKPVSRRILYRNFYPDPAAGEDIHKGDFTWERDDVTRTTLSKLKGVPGYIDCQISRVMSEGPMTAKKEFATETEYPGLRISEEARKNLFEIWYYYGSMKRSDLMTIEYTSEHLDVEDYKDKDLDEYVYVQVTMVNNRVIKATISHISTGDFPYDLMVWQRRIGMPWGIGVARQVRPAQRIVVGAMRHMMDNAGIAGGPMVYLDTNVVQAADGINEIKPWKVFISADDYEPGQNRVGEAIRFIKAPMVQEELQRIIDLGLKLAETITGLPLIMQGQTSQTTPKTLGGTVIQNNNASTVLRRVIKLYDDMVTEPHTRRYYNHLLLYSDDDGMKGEFNIVALGSSSLIERDMAGEAMAQLGQAVLNPIFKKDPVKWLNEMLKMNKLEPSKFEYDDEEWQKLVEQMSAQAAGPQDTSLEVEQMRQQGAQQLAQFKAQSAAEILQLKSQLDSTSRDQETAFKMQELQSNNQNEQQDRELKLGIAQLTSEITLQLAQLKDVGDDRRQLGDIKQRLQDTVMKLQTQVQLSGTEAIAPPVEPKGRAPEGQSFTK